MNSFQAEMKRRRIAADEQLQTAIVHINDIATRACKNGGEGIESLDWTELHSLRAAATAWAESCAHRYKMKSQGEPFTHRTMDEERDADDDTARYVLSPF